METNRALITCITGQDGSYLAEFLLGQGYTVFGTSTSHAIAARIRKCVDAAAVGSPDIVVWGSGSTRASPFGEDAAEAIVLASERYDDAEPSTWAPAARSRSRASSG